MYLKLRTDIEPGTRTIAEQTGRYLLEFFDNDPPIDRISRQDAAEWRASLARGELAAAKAYPKPKDSPDYAAESGQVSGKNWRRKRRRGKLKAVSEATVAKHVQTAKRIFSEASEEDGGRSHPEQSLPPAQRQGAASRQGLARSLARRSR